MQHFRTKDQSQIHAHGVILRMLDDYVKNEQNHKQKSISIVISLHAVPT